LILANCSPYVDWVCLVAVRAGQPYSSTEEDPALEQEALHQGPKYYFKDFYKELCKDIREAFQDRDQTQQDENGRLVAFAAVGADG
jgi:hypothetical protein